MAHWFAFFISAVAALSTPAWADLQFSLEPALIQPGERARFTVTLPEADLQLPPDAPEEMVPQAQDEALTEIKDLQLLEQDYRKLRGQYLWTYDFTSYTPGLYTLPAFPIQLGPQTFSTQRLTVTVKSARAAEDTALRPDAEALSPPWPAWFWWTSGLTLALAMAAYFLRNRLRLPQRKPVELRPPPTPPEDPADWLRKQLLILRARLDTSPQEPQAPDLWTEIVKEYAARVKSQPVRAWTTGEFAHHLRHEEKLVAVGRLLLSCDIVKFARAGRAPGEVVKQILAWTDETERALL